MEKQHPMEAYLHSAFVAVDETELAIWNLHDGKDKLVELADEYRALATKFWGIYQMAIQYREHLAHVTALHKEPVGCEEDV